VCHPERSEGSYDVFRVVVVAGAGSLHAAQWLLSTLVLLPAIVGSFEPASPPLRMTAVLEITFCWGQMAGVG
jgi:hypothetical protein